MSNKIALVFDFDETLAADSTTALLEYMKIDTKKFWGEEVHKLIIAGWDPIPAYLYKMIEYSQVKEKITKDIILKVGKSINFYKGVTRIFSVLKKHVETKNNIELEFFIISSGIGDLLRATKIAKYFTDIWACDFIYNGKNEIMFPKKIVSFTDKTRYLFHISKGLVGDEYRNKPFDVNKKNKNKNYYIPFNQMIFVGDGATDIPCFSLVRKMGGISIAVYDDKNTKKWGIAWEFVEEDRAVNLVPADYSKNSALLNSLKMSINSIMQKMEVEKNTYQG